MVFHWNLNDSISPRVSRTLLSIFSDLNNAAISMVPIRPRISTPHSKSLGTVPSAPVTINITVTLIFYYGYLFVSFLPL